MRYIIGLLAIVVLVIFGVVLFTGGNDRQAVTEQGIVLHDYADTDAVVRLTIDGPIIAQEEHRAVRITVNRSQRKIEILRGYEGRALRTETFSNTQASYESFLYALGNLGFTRSRQSNEESFMGVCPDDNRYIYDIIDGGDSVQQLWSGDCSSRIGTLAGEETEIQELFQAQIPGYDELTDDLEI